LIHAAQTQPFSARALQKIGDKNSVGLTQDYGSRLAYWGWKNISSWPTHGDLIYHNDLRGAHDGRDFGKQFEELALKKELFLVTDLSDLALQPFLQEKLLEYPVFAKGNGYVIYDISQ
jgi:hypothetical protein